MMSKCKYCDNTFTAENKKHKTCPLCETIECYLSSFLRSFAGKSFVENILRQENNKRKKLKFRLSRDNEDIDDYKDDHPCFYIYYGESPNNCYISELVDLPETFNEVQENLFEYTEGSIEEGRKILLDCGLEEKS